MGGVPRVAGCAVIGIFVGRTHGKFIHIGAAERYHALVEQVLHHGGGVGGNEVVEHFAGTGAAPAGLAEDVFVGDWHAGKRGGFSGGNARVGGAGFGEGLFFVKRDVAVDGGVVRGDGFEVFARQFDGGDLFGL